MHNVPLSSFIENEEKLEFAITEEEMFEMTTEHDPLVNIKGTRAAADKIIEKIKASVFKNYGTSRDDPTLPTTFLATYIKFGLLSCRQVLEAVRGNEVLTAQIYWREFYYYVTWHDPKLLDGQIGEANKAMKIRMQNIKWKEAEGTHWDAWCEGKTGIPIVDAGQRQLLQTGEMHNRARMVSAMFLTKNLHISWIHGEKFFAQHLIDYDPCQNNGGWQWSASTGVDTQPYRIFNPWLQVLYIESLLIFR